MKISVLCTDPRHPVIPHLQVWCETTRLGGHEVTLVFDKSQLPGGDLLFLVSCGQLIKEVERNRYGNVLVLHAGNLPKDRGWSPHVWAIINGAREINVCLIEASEPVDSGDVWLRERFWLEGHELFAEINQKLFATELSLMTRAVSGLHEITPAPQEGDPGPYLRKRTPEDSRVDPQKTVAEQFDLLRVADPARYPAFMDFRGHRYVIKIEKGADHAVEE